jgi:hypothetical protein
MPLNTRPVKQETLFAELDEKLTLKTGRLQPEMGVQGTCSRIQSKHTCTKTTQYKYQKLPGKLLSVQVMQPTEPHGTEAPPRRQAQLIIRTLQV